MRKLWHAIRGYHVYDTAYGFERVFRLERVRIILGDYDSESLISIPDGQYLDCSCGRRHFYEA